MDNKNFSISKSRRVRSTPFTSRIEKQGISSYSVYNHMLIPVTFGSLEKEYFHLKEHVQVWDVSVQRQIEISGNDSFKLVQSMTCRDLSESKIGRCYYSPLVDDKGNLINDPVILKLDENKWRISIADSDVILFAKGLAIGNEFDVKIKEAKIDTIAIQGPKSFKLMEKIFGKKITELKFFQFDYFDFKETKHMIGRLGWSKQGGYEIYVEKTDSGLDLYDYFFEAGKEFNVKPGAPNLIERIESGLLSYGNDMDNKDNPYECGFDKYINLDSNTNFLGKESLKKIRSQGIKRKLMGVKIDMNQIDLTKEEKLHDKENNEVGFLRSAVFSPNFKKVVGIAMINKKYCKESQEFKISINGKSATGKICSLPLV